MNSVIDLRANICSIFDDLRSGAILPNVAKELNNSAGKIIGTVKVELEYFALRKEPPDIQFIRDLAASAKKK